MQVNEALQVEVLLCVLEGDVHDTFHILLKEVTHGEPAPNSDAAPDAVSTKATGQQGAPLQVS